MTRPVLLALAAMAALVTTDTARACEYQHKVWLAESEKAGDQSPIVGHILRLKGRDDGEQIVIAGTYFFVRPDSEIEFDPDCKPSITGPRIDQARR
jgi:hypothetical protein